MTDAPVFRSTYVAPDDDARSPEPRGSGGRAVSVLVLVVLVVTALAVGWIGSLATTDNVDGWYAAADKPAWTPPGVVFGPVWTLLYISMGVAAWLVWRRRHEARVRPALVAYVVQLALNSIWTPVFFGLYPVVGVGALWAALAIISALIVAVIVTLVAFWRVHRVAGVLLMPYLAWLLYASTLNAGIAILQS